MNNKQQYNNNFGLLEVQSVSRRIVYRYACLFAPCENHISYDENMLFTTDAMYQLLYSL